MHACIHAHVHKYTHARIKTCIHTCTHTYNHAYTQIETHTYTYVYTHIDKYTSIFNQHLQAASWPLRDDYPRLHPAEGSVRHVSTACHRPAMMNRGAIAKTQNMHTADQWCPTVVLTAKSRIATACSVMMVRYVNVWTFFGAASTLSSSCLVILQFSR